jgi:hypothetical protein
MLAYIQMFCRSVVLLVFIISFASKVSRIATFQQTITSFALLPRRFSRSAAYLFLLAEALVAMLVLLGGPLLLPGYLLASALLLLFCAALLSVIIRRISTTCSCFGPTTTPVSAIDIVRNTGFIACSFGGCLTLTGPVHLDALDLAAWALSGLCALVFVGIWTQLGEIVRLFR